VWAPELRLGCAIVPAFTRAPAILVQSVAAQADAAPGRFTFGIGTSSEVVVRRWNGVPFDQPYRRTRDVVRFMRAALQGEKVTVDADTFSIDGFRLSRVPREVPPILIAALRPGMLRLAGRESDGAILNWLSADDVATVAPIVHEAAAGAPRELVARSWVCPTEDADAARAVARRSITTYLNVPVYRAFHEWLGRGDALASMFDAWSSGDRKAALAAVPDSVIDDLVVHGSPSACRDRIQQFVDNGVTAPLIALLAVDGVDPAQAVRDLAPR
jgi:probable F420-dependent oxidoreductase